MQSEMVITDACTLDPLAPPVEETNCQGHRTGLWAVFLSCLRRRSAVGGLYEASIVGKVGVRP
jgi:hypothetical protein